jgi:hypothetical protein
LVSEHDTFGLSLLGRDERASRDDDDKEERERERDFLEDSSNPRFSYSRTSERGRHYY